MKTRVAIYARVSTDGQTVENQRRELEEVAERSRWEVVQVYEDKGISGTKGREKRPAFDRLCKDATRRRFDLIAAWSIDRIGRSVHTVSQFMADMDRLGIRQFYLKQAIDTSTAAGKAMVQMCVVFAEFERDMIVERINAGLKRARAQGKQLGRPKVSAEVDKAIRKALAAGKGVNKVARELGVGTGTVQRRKDKLEAERGVK
jgi:DNA invertase Pin-like site-specific DNA recombinase